MSSLYSIIVTYNGEKWIKNCLDSVIIDSDEVIVIDNASTDQTLKIIKEQFNNVTLFELSENLGFGRANNIGIMYAYGRGAEHILLINQDARVKDGCISELQNVQKNNPKLGVVTPVHLNGDETGLDLHFSQFLGRSKRFSLYISDSLLGNAIQSFYEIDYANAALWMLSRTCIEKVGLFNPSFQHYGEDLNYLERVQYYGFKIGLVPLAFGVHERNQTYFGEGKLSSENIFLKAKAEIVHRISRLQTRSELNLLSTSYYIITMYKHSLQRKIHLFYYLLINYRRIMKNRTISKKNNMAYFDSAGIDQINFIRNK